MNETSCAGFSFSGKFLSLKPSVDFAAGGANEVNNLSYVSPAGLEMARYPFTNDQLKEVERQAMIYNKYIVSSLPVPPHLLFPVSTYFPSLMWHSRNNGDPEPGRCKRTDGKKWRCSKEVVILHKYCERHLHIGRARSRKPVEVGKNRKKARPEQSRSDVSNANEPLLLFDAKKTGSSVLTTYAKGNDGLVTTPEHPWHHLIEPNTGLMANEGLLSYASNAAIFNQDYADQHPLSNIFSYPTFPTPEMELPIGFIDAWAVDNNPNCKEDGNLESSILINEDNTNTSPSLDLSMAMAYCDHDCNKSNPFPYEPFAQGGPLGEAVHGSGPSSPSAVLHRNLFTHSDGSVCNSPTFGVPPSEVSIKWFN